MKRGGWDLFETSSKIFRKSHSLEPGTTLRRNCNSREICYVHGWSDVVEVLRRKEKMNWGIASILWYSFIIAMFPSILVAAARNIP